MLTQDLHYPETFDVSKICHAKTRQFQGVEVVHPNIIIVFVMGVFVP
jgi:hypothetical protein